MKRLVLTVGILIGTALPVLAQRVPVRVTHTGSDAVGQQVATSLKAALGESKRYVLHRPGDLTGAEIRIAAADSGIATGADRAAATAVLFRVSWACGAETRPVEQDPKLQVRTVGAAKAKDAGTSLLAEYESWVDEAQPTACIVPAKDGTTSKTGGVVWFVLRMDK